MRVVVLGMHKSGTSLVAQTLHRSGFWMGEFREELDYSSGNRHEHHAFQAVNRDVLSAYLSAPLSHRLRRSWLPDHDQAGYPTNQDSLAWIHWRALERDLPSQPSPAAAQRLIEEMDRKHGDWGFKDPRTALTYPVWRRLLPDHRIVVVFRGLGQVLERYRAGPRHPVRTLRVIRAWTIYNWSILRHLETAACPVLVLRYERLMSEPDALAPLSAFVGRAVHDARDPEGHRSRGGSSALPGWMRASAGRLPAHPASIEESLSALEASTVEQWAAEPESARASRAVV